LYGFDFLQKVTREQKKIPPSPNVIRYFDSEVIVEAGGKKKVFLLFELAEGGTLFDLMMSAIDTKLSEDTILGIAAQVAK
jgi:serine/threonine protein kinase